MYRPRLEPMAAPVYTIGASAPTEPPNPIVRALVTSDEYMLCRLILDSFLDTACRTFVTPWPMLSRTRYRTMRKLRSMPTPGRSRNSQFASPTRDSRPLWIARIVTFSRTAARPHSKPVTTDRMGMWLRCGRECKRARNGPQRYFTILFSKAYSSSEPLPYWAMLSSGRVSPAASEASALPPATASFSASSSPSSQRSTSSRSSVLTLIFTR